MAKKAAPEQVKVSRTYGMSLTAAARQIDLRSPSIARLSIGPSEKQSKAFEYHKDLGIVRQAIKWKQDRLRAVRLVAGIRTNDGEILIPNDDQRNEAWKRAQADVTRLGGKYGTTGQTLSLIAKQFEIAGECYLHLWVDENGVEDCKVRSVAEVVKENKQLYVKTGDGDKDRQAIGPEDVLIRLWMQDAEKAWVADSPLMAMAEECEELLILSRMIRGVARSRIAQSGVMLVPEDIAYRTDTALSQETSSINVLVNDVVEHFTAPIIDESSAAGVAPFVLPVPADAIDKIKILTADRPLDKQSMETRAELRTVIAAGLAVPTEVLTGFGDVNHWTGWLIDEQSWKDYLEPTCQAITVALQEGYFSKSDADGYVITYDATDLVGIPRNQENAAAAWSANMLSESAYVRELGFSENDLPTNDELRRRLALTPGALPPDVQVSELRALGILPDAPADVEPVAVPVPADDSDDDEPEVEEDDSTPDTGPGLTAAAVRPRALGARLAQVDQRLLDRLILVCEREVIRALEVAGAKLRRQAGKMASLQDVAQADVAFALGEARVVELAGSFQNLADQDYTGLAEAWGRELSRAQRETLAILEAEYDDLDEDETQARLEESQQAGLLVLLAGIRTLVADLLKKGTGGVAEPDDESLTGEALFAGARVPVSLIRRALAVAGGAPVARVAKGGGGVSDNAATGVAQGYALGEIVQEIEAAFGNTPVAYVWDYGDPSTRVKNFEPHLALNGRVFTSMTDMALANNESWPPEAFYFPGDHVGCLCQAVPVYDMKEVADALES